MHPILNEIFTNGIYLNENKRIIIHSETSKDQCVFLQKLISVYNCKKSIEIGLAYGISSLAIMESISKNNGNNHVIIDKFQNDHWNNIGLKILDDAGFRNSYTFHEEYCYKVLSLYITQNKVFDFAYIDSTKLFDWILTDFFLLDKLIKTNGIIVFDDANYPSIRKVIRFVVSLPYYRIIGVYPENKRNSKRQILKHIISIIPYHKKIFSEDLLKTDYDIGINTNCIAVQKISRDARKYDWHIPF